MSNLTYYDSDGLMLDHFTQWDIGQTIVIKNLQLDDAPNVHFANKNHKQAIVVRSEFKDSDLYVDVPNILLQENAPIIIYLYCKQNENSYKTINITTINVIPRARPDDYEYRENIEYVSWTQLSDEALQLISDMNSAINNATTATETANTAAKNAKTATSNANAATKAANNAAASANSATTETKAATNLAQGAADLAINAADLAEDAAEFATDIAKNIQFRHSSGEIITITNAVDGPLRAMKVFGKTTQNGTPTPDTPAPLESAGAKGTICVTAAGKNVLLNNAVSQKINDVTFTVNPDKSITMKGPASDQIVYTLYNGNGDLARLQAVPNGEYIVSGIPGGSDQTYYFTAYDGTEAVKSDQFYAYSSDAKVNITKGYIFQPRIVIRAGTAVDVTFYPMVRPASFEDDTYEPYVIDTTTVQTPNGLPGIPVSSGGNYTDKNDQQWICDEIDFEHNRYVQRVGQVVLDGDEATIGVDTLNYNGVSYKRINYKLSDADLSDAKRVVVLSDRFGLYRGAITYGIAMVSSSGSLCLYLREDMQNLDPTQAKQWLTKNPVTAQYILAEEKYTYLDAEELNEFAAMCTHYPNTTIYTDSGAYMEVMYAAPQTAVPITGARMAGDIDMFNHRLTGIRTPEKTDDAANKLYVDTENAAVKKIAEDANAKADTLREIVRGLHNNIVETAKGEVVAVSEASDLELAGLKIYGRTIQNGIPSIDVPAPLESIGETVNVTLCGKNLVDQSKAYVASNISNTQCELTAKGVRVFTTASGTYKGAMLKEMTLKKGVPYTLSATLTENNGTYARVGFRRARLTDYGKENEFIGGTSITFSSLGRSSISFTLDHDEPAYLAMLVTWSTATDGDATFTDIQLEVGTTATEYEPYKERTAVSENYDKLCGVKVTSGGNYTDENGQWWCDEIDHAAGKIIRRTINVVLDGTQDVRADEDQKTGYHRIWFNLGYFEVYQGVGAEHASSRLKSSQSKTENGWYVTKPDKNNPSSYVCLCLSQDMAGSSRDAIRAWLADNPIEIVVARADVQTERFLQHPSIFDGLNTYYPNTTVYNDAGAYMEVGYIADTKLYVDNKFRELASAILNN